MCVCTGDMYLLSLFTWHRWLCKCVCGIQSCVHCVSRHTSIVCMCECVYLRCTLTECVFGIWFHFIFCTRDLWLQCYAPRIPILPLIALNVLKFISIFLLTIFNDSEFFSSMYGHLGYVSTLCLHYTICLYYAYTRDTCLYLVCSGDTLYDLYAFTIHVYIDIHREYVKICFHDCTAYLLGIHIYGNWGLLIFVFIVEFLNINCLSIKDKCVRRICCLNNKKMFIVFFCRLQPFKPCIFPVHAFTHLNTFNYIFQNSKLILTATRWVSRI